MTIINDDARIVNKLDASLTDDSRVIIFDHHMFIVQATECFLSRKRLQPHSLERIARDKHPSLLQKFENYELKKFYKTDP